MTFKFQVEVGPDSWTDFGSGQGSGLNPIGSAIHQLMKANGGMLEAGRYRYRAVDGVTQDWSRLTFDTTCAYAMQSRPQGLTVDA